MTDSARDIVLGRIRTALSGSDGGPAPPDLWPPRAWTRPRCGNDVVADFTAKAALNHCTIQRIAARAELVAAVQRIVIADDLATRVAVDGISVSPSLQDLPWPRSWAVNTGPGRATEVVAVTDAVAGIGETGSVVLRSDAEHPASLNFLPELHICVVRAIDLVPHMEDVWPKLRDLSVWPRAVNIVSGPSRTADVAQIVVRPAHGPKALHIVLVGEP